MNNYLDKMAQGSTGTPDCSGENCEVISILINLGDPCGGYSETGHVGLGVGKDYYDTYPGGEHRYEDEEGVNMARIEKKYRTGQGTGSILIEFCMCKDGADFAREKMKSFLTEGLKPVQCTSAVCSALFGTPAILSGLENPRNFAPKLTPQDVPFGGVLDNRPINQCGAEKGKRANVKIIQRPDRALDQ